VAQLCLPQFADKGSCPEVCGKPQAPPAIRAPYYGMLFTQMAIAGLPRMLKGTQVEKVSGVVLKAHTLSADDGEELRIVLVRKGGDAAQRVTVRVTGVFGEGALSLLAAPEYTSRHENVTIAGQQVNEMGELLGERETSMVDVAYLQGSSLYVVDMPPASAGMLVVRRALEEM